MTVYFNLNELRIENGAENQPMVSVEDKTQPFINIFGEMFHLLTCRTIMWMNDITEAL